MFAGAELDPLGVDGKPVQTRGRGWSWMEHPSHLRNRHRSCARLPSGQKFGLGASGKPTQHSTQPLQVFFRMVELINRSS